MKKMRAAGWQKLIEGYPWFAGEGRYPISAYSEFMPAPRVGRSLYGDIDEALFAPNDAYGWRVPEIEEEYELRPGLENIARQVIGHLMQLGRGLPAAHVVGRNRRLLMEGNRYWLPELEAHLGHLDHERYVLLLPVALAKTQDYLGRVRWTLFGNSEQGPERAFWRSFYTTPAKEIPVRDSRGWISQLLSSVYGETTRNTYDLLQIGFRILPSSRHERFPYWHVRSLPKWTRPFLMDDDAALKNVRYLLTFRPFSELPTGVRAKYLTGKLALIPSPFSLVFWGMQSYYRAQEQSPLAIQSALAPLVARHEGPGIRVPQAAWLHEPRCDGQAVEISEELLLNTYTRTHRWDRVRRDEDAVAHSTHVDKVTEALFSTALIDLDLYNKPLARNSQIWTSDSDLLLDGPHAKRADIVRAATAVLEGGLFRYFFHFPAMRVGQYEVYWQRPLAAYWSHQADQVKMLEGTLPGYFTAYDSERPDVAHPVELYPRLLQRPVYLDALRYIDDAHDHYRHQTALNVLTLLDMSARWTEQRLPRSFARQMLRIAKEETIDDWSSVVRARATQPAVARRLMTAIEQRLEPTDRPLPDPITYDATATRVYEEAYWNDLVTLSHGRYVNKVNSDVVQDEPTKKRIAHPHRDLRDLGEYLIRRHREAIAAAGLEGVAQVGELPFKWETDFDFTLYGGWQRDQEGKEYERNLLVVIPGKNRGEAVVMGDHYDTAYMEDAYYTERGGDGARLGAAGADDNASATATLLQAAPIFLKLAKQGKLERDVWLIHLTGEEFPADCMGARKFCQALVEKSLQLHVENDHWIDLSETRVVGVLVMDMIAHNRDNARNIFQISPGKSVDSLRLAYEAHLANRVWNEKSAEWNQRPERHGLGPGVRSADGKTMPSIARHPRLDGEVRTVDDPQSSVFNTDVQIFSDIGAPCLLMMEDYDISRTGYHDSRDTLENIDLDYGAAVSAICIETLARVATLQT